MQYDIICKDRYMYVGYNMDEHWIYYAELMKPAIGSGEDNETSSKEIKSCWTWWFIMKKTSGTHDTNCDCAKYKLLNDLQDLIKKSKHQV